MEHKTHDYDDNNIYTLGHRRQNGVSLAIFENNMLMIAVVWYKHDVLISVILDPCSVRARSTHIIKTLTFCNKCIIMSTYDEQGVCIIYTTVCRGIVFLTSNRKLLKGNVFFFIFIYISIFMYL